MPVFTTLDGPRLEPRSGKPARQLIVLLHGYGADGEDLIALGEAWAPDFPDAAFVAPNAPDHLPFEGLAGRQWFPLEERDMREYRLGVEAVHPLLNRFLDQELERTRLPSSALAIAGFSQGAMLALHTGLRRKDLPAAVLAYSGLLAGPELLIRELTVTPPVLLVHGEDDTVVDSVHLPAAEAALLGAGLAVESHSLPGVGHAIDGRGIALGRDFLAGAFVAAALGGGLGIG